MTDNKNTIIVIGMDTGSGHDMRVSELTPVFVEIIPETLEEGKLYISKEYRTSQHLCVCGCKGKTVLPLNPDGWNMTENSDGTITLRPSVGNWTGQNPYHAHYHITNNKIEWL